MYQVCIKKRSISAENFTTDAAELLNDKNIM